MKHRSQYFCLTLLIPFLTLDVGQHAVKTMLLHDSRAGLQDAPASLPNMANSDRYELTHCRRSRFHSLMTVYFMLWRCSMLFVEASSICCLSRDDTLF